MIFQCEHCGEDLKTPKKISNKHRGLIKNPKTHKVLTCYSCGKKNFVRIQ